MQTSFIRNLFTTDPAPARESDGWYFLHVKSLRSRHGTSYINICTGMLRKE